MDYGSALEVLGVSDDDGVTRDQLRRIYMRKLRLHPPEKDPAGFKRLREAFEYLREWLPEDEEPREVIDVARAEGPGIVVIDVSAGRLPEPSAAVAAPSPEPEPDANTGTEPEPEPDPDPPPVPDDGPRILRTLADLPPLATSTPTPEPPMPLERLVETLLVMLQHDEVDAAAELARRWQAGGDTDDRRYATDYTAARWALTRELLGVAPNLPASVTAALAKAIARDNVETARDDLIAFRKRDSAKASAANTVLAANAQMLHRQIEGTLWVPAPAAPPKIALPPRITPPPASYRAPDLRPKSSASGIWVAVLIVGACIRACMAIDSGSHYSAPKYDIKIPKLDYRMPEIDYAALARASIVTPEPPPAFDPSADRAKNIADIQRLAIELSLYPITTEDQRAFARELSTIYIDDDCAKLRPYRDGLLVAPGMSGEKEKASAEAHIAAISVRVDAICPKAKPRKPRKKAP
jgi:hypothetical protein